VTIVLEAGRLEVPKALLETFDIIAVSPQTDAALRAACASPDVDVVTLDATGRRHNQRGALRLHRAAVLEARRRGACFELTYADAVVAAGSSHSLTLRDLVACAARLAELCHGKGVVLSSGARDARSQHAPPDVANLARVLGFASQASLVVAHARARRYRRRASKAAGLVSRWVRAAQLADAVPGLLRENTTDDFHVGAPNRREEESPVLMASSSSSSSSSSEKQRKKKRRKVVVPASETPLLLPTGDRQSLESRLP